MRTMQSNADTHQKSAWTRFSDLALEREVKVFPKEKLKSHPGPKQNTKAWPGHSPANLFSDFDQNHINLSDF